MAEILTIDANKLDVLLSPQEGQSFVMFNQRTNRGLSIDYEKLAEAILGKVLTNNMPYDGLKLMVVDN